MKILIALLTMVTLITSVSAHENDDKLFKEQCQYRVDGKGSNNEFVAGLMQGFIDGVTYKVSMQQVTEFAITATKDTISLKACENVFDNKTKSGFMKAFHDEIHKLMIKK